MNKAIWISRVTLALIFVWFGALKFIGVSPVVPIIEQAYPWVMHTAGLYTLLAFLEIALGIGILVPRFTKLVGVALIVHLMFATAGVLISPQAFPGGFPLLSVVGEFVIKNFALMALALVILCHRKIARI